MFLSKMQGTKRGGGVAKGKQDSHSPYHDAIGIGDIEMVCSRWDGCWVLQNKQGGGDHSAKEGKNGGRSGMAT